MSECQTESKTNASWRLVQIAIETDPWGFAPLNFGETSER